MTWVQLRRGSDWGAEYFYRPDRPKTPAGTYSRDSGVAFKEGQTVRVRWPDGAETTERVKHQRRTQSVQDMWNRYDVSSDLAGIEVVVHGLPAWFPLDAVKIHDGDARPMAQSGEPPEQKTRPDL